MTFQWVFGWQCFKKKKGKQEMVMGLAVNVGTDTSYFSATLFIAHF